MNCEVENEVEKIKVTSAEIVVHGNVNKPYYEIKYYPIDGGCYIGYSSYDLKIVSKWLKECFDILGHSSKFNLEIYRNYLDMKIANLKEIFGNSEVSKEKKMIYKEQILLLKALRFESEIFED